MKKFLMLIAPLLIAVLIFFVVLFFVNRSSGKGALQVTSVPKSRVYLENKLVGTTPLCVCDAKQMLSIGEYAVRLVPLDGSFGPYETKVTINKSTLTVVDRTFAGSGQGEGSSISLIPIIDKKDAEVLVISLPDKANVFLDNNPVGITPLLLKQVSESDHDLRLTLDGYKNKSIKIKTALGFKLSAVVEMGVNADLSVPQVALISASPAATVSASILILNTPTGFLNVREGASINAAIIAQVRPGESRELIGEEDNWFEIKLTNGKKGWISSSYAVKE